MDYQKTDLLRVLQASLTDLHLLSKDLKAKSTLQVYAEVLRAYLESDLTRLRELNEQSQGFTNAAVKALIDTRLAIRENRAEATEIQKLVEVGDKDADWQGETLIIAGFASETLADYTKAKDFYYRSFKSFEGLGAPVKALKALHNYISASSKLDPEKTYFAEFHTIIQKATDLGSLDIAGTALMNLSREFQKMKAYKTALKYANRSLTSLQGAAGTYHHHMAVLNHCHILCDLGRYELANEDFNLIKASPYPEVQSGLKVLEQIMTEAKTNPVLKTEIHPTWLERLAEGKNTEEPLSDLEERLLTLLATKPRDKYALISDLYGDNIELAAAENRLKNVLSRLRKKMPGKILFEEGLYSLTDGESLDIE